jgi:hypothetical protein
MSQSTLKLLSLVAMAAVAPLLGIYVILMIAATPNATGGMEPIVATNSYFAFTCIFGAMIVVAINFSRQLAAEAKGEKRLP